MVLAMVLLLNIIKTYSVTIPLIPGWGNGHDGNVTINGIYYTDDDRYIVNGIYVGNVVGLNGIGGVWNFATNDAVIIIQMEPGATGTVGRFELANVVSVSYPQITVSASADLSGFDLSNGGKVQCIIVPQFSALTLVAGSFVTCQPYDHSTGTGGILTFMVSRQLTIDQDAVINASEKGYGPTIINTTRYGYGGYGGAGAIACPTQSPGGTSVPLMNGTNGKSGPSCAIDGGGLTALPGLCYTGLVNLTGAFGGDGGQPDNAGTPGTVSDPPFDFGFDVPASYLLVMGASGKGGDGGNGGGAGGTGGGGGGGAPGNNGDPGLVGTDGNQGGDGGLGGRGGGAILILAHDISVTATATNQVLIFSNGATGGMGLSGGTDLTKGAGGNGGDGGLGDCTQPSGSGGAPGMRGNGADGGNGGDGGSAGTVWALYSVSAGTCNLTATNITLQGGACGVGGPGGPYYPTPAGFGVTKIYDLIPCSYPVIYYCPVYKTEPIICNPFRVYATLANTTNNSGTIPNLNFYSSLTPPPPYPYYSVSTQRWAPDGLEFTADFYEDIPAINSPFGTSTSPEIFDHHIYTAKGAPVYNPNDCDDIHSELQARQGFWTANVDYVNHTVQFDDPPDPNFPIFYDGTIDPPQISDASGHVCVFTCDPVNLPCTGDCPLQGNPGKGGNSGTNKNPYISAWEPIKQGIDLATGGTNIQIKPNPASKNINISIVTKKPGLIQLEIRSIPGIISLTKTFVCVSGVNNFTLNISNMSPGIYFCVFTDQKEQKIKTEVLTVE